MQFGYFGEYGKLEYYQASEYRYDCSATWKITFIDKQAHTVKEFVDEIVKTRDKDWGEFDIIVNDITYYRVIKYQYGKIIEIREEIFNNVANKKTTCISADGGWNNMTYYIKI